MKSTIGRPRRVTDAQIQKILAWHEEWLELNAKRKSLKTLRQLCEELKLAKGTVHRVIRTHGQFKQTSPEHRQRELAERQALLRQVRGRAKNPRAAGR